MTSHYYTEQPESEHKFEQWSFELLGKSFHFVTDSGVFSRNTVDFGSRVLLGAFQWQDLPDGRVLDVGCGYGPIGLAVASVTNRLVEMIDINQRAVDLAKKNAQKNQLTQVDIHTSYIYDDLHEIQYAAIISNPPIRAGKKVVHGILSGAYPLLITGGTLTIVIQKKQGAPSAQKKMNELFGNVEIVAKEKGYYVLKSVKEVTDNT